MTKSTKDAPKKRGRPATGKDPIVGVRFPVDTITRLDAEANKRGVKKSELVRDLVNDALSRLPKMKK